MVIGRGGSGARRPGRSPAELTTQVSWCGAARGSDTDTSAGACRGSDAARGTAAETRLECGLWVSGSWSAATADMVAIKAVLQGRFEARGDVGTSSVVHHACRVLCRAI